MRAAARRLASIQASAPPAIINRTPKLRDRERALDGRRLLSVLTMSGIRPSTTESTPRDRAGSPRSRVSDRARIPRASRERPGVGTSHRAPVDQLAARGGPSPAVRRPADQRTPTIATARGGACRASSWRSRDRSPPPDRRSVCQRVRRPRTLTPSFRAGVSKPTMGSADRRGRRRRCPRARGLDVDGVVHALISVTPSAVIASTRPGVTHLPAPLMRRGITRDADVMPTAAMRPSLISMAHR